VSAPPISLAKDPPVPLSTEQLLVPWLRAFLNVRAVTELPANLATVTPIIDVARIGGGSDDNNPSFEFPTVSIDCYAANVTDTMALAMRVDRAIRVNLPGQPLANRAVVTRTDTISGPSFRPYDDLALRRFGATYRILIKQPV